MGARSLNGPADPNHQKLCANLAYKCIAPNQSHDIRSGNPISSCHPLNWPKFAMRSRRYPEARISMKTAGWCTYLIPLLCRRVPTLFHSMWCNTNWGDLLQPAPLSIALLGSLMVISSSTSDFCPSLPFNIAETVY